LREQIEFGINFEFITSAPTISATIAPTISSTNIFPQGPPDAAGRNDNGAGIIVGSVSGVLLSVLGVGFTRYWRRRNQPQNFASKTLTNSWSEPEIARFREVYRNNHDFETLCQAFPDRTRESVAERARSLMIHNPTYFGRDSYLFLRERLTGACNKLYSTTSPFMLVSSRVTVGGINQGVGPRANNGIYHKKPSPYSSASNRTYKQDEALSSFQPMDNSTNFREPTKISPPPGLYYSTSNPQFSSGNNNNGNINRSMASTVSY
jgi:hypothetical protein